MRWVVSTIITKPTRYCFWHRISADVNIILKDPQNTVSRIQGIVAKFVF